jgi:uncharacterized protein involved in cysteine biosynthesis
MGYVISGLGFIREHRLGRYVWGPVLASLAIFVAVVVGGYMLLVPWLSGWLGGFGLAEGVGRLLAGAVYLVLWWFLAMTVFIGIVGLFSSFLWDRISIKVETVLRGEAAARGPGCAGQAFDSALRIMFAALIGILALLVGCITLGIGSVLLVGLLGLNDFTASYHVRRGILLPRQFGRMFRYRGWFGYMLSAGLLTLVPIVNVFMFPALVAGGTMMCLDSEASGNRLEGNA